MKKLLLMTIAITAFMPRTVAQFYNSADVDGTAGYSAGRQNTITLPWSNQYCVVIHRDATASRISVLRQSHFVTQQASQPWMPAPSFPNILYGSSVAVGGQ